ncbi:MAG: VanW family protein [Candidatus Berkelbacteria bacterium]|nr:VanW family protein [Candidatus Berkelbacteria bacterium]
MAQKKEKQESKRIRLWKKIKWPTIFVGSFLVFILIILGIYSLAYGKTTYRNIYVGSANVGGKSHEQVTEILTPILSLAEAADINLKYQPESGDSKPFTIKNSDIDLKYNVEETANMVFAVGRAKNPLISFYQQAKTLLFKYQVDADYSISADKLATKIAEIAAGIDIPEKDFSLAYAGGGKFTLATEKQEGNRVNQGNLIDEIKDQRSKIKMAEVDFKTEKYPPQITEENANKSLVDANRILAGGNLALAANSKNFTLDVDSIAGLIGSRPKGKELEIYILPDQVQKQVAGFAAAVDTPAGNAVLTVVNGQVAVSNQSQNGAKLDREAATATISAAILDRIDQTQLPLITLKVDQIAPEIDSTKLKSYGLTELVASGTTNFVKSPANRIHNIGVGATAINGTLLKPGEEFSTLGHLGKINASTGYLPELVIKDNKTVPDYGGGLCQVSTTLFRAALNAGMKITERQNHSYRVSYYEPPIGMDATIYDPSPDFKFVNNYSSYIFIQSVIVGTKLTFEFYGTKDDRQITIGAASGFDYVEPPSPVETLDPTLPAGTRNLISHAHQGASAKFHYQVILSGTILQSTDFLSHYVALPEQWQVGPPADPVAAMPPAG